jgi:hypothetical protein
MKNTVVSFKPQSNSLGSYRKEKHGLFREYRVLDLDSVSTSAFGIPQASSPAIVRVYWPSETAFACVWLSTADAYAIGKGKAGGYGYCKLSGAVDSALRDAGIELQTSIHGVGESAILEALNAFARFAGLKNWIITTAHA